MKEREEKDLKECSHNVLASGVGPVFSSGRKERKKREEKGALALLMEMSTCSINSPEQQSNRE